MSTETHAVDTDTHAAGADGAGTGAARKRGIRPLSFGPSFGFGFSAALVVAAAIRYLGSLAGREGVVVEIALYCCVALCVFAASLCLAHILKDRPASARSGAAAPPAPTPIVAPELEPEQDPVYIMNEQETMLLASKKLAMEYSLTKREEELALLLAKGYSNVQIEEELGLSKNTVKTHLRHIYAKTETHSRKELAALFESIE